MPATLYHPSKRLFDLIAALGALTLCALPMALIACAIALTAGRPVLFTQERIGLDGRPFRLLKFRTMRPDRSGGWNPAADAARLTRLGRFLRRWSLDELPQLWNVIRGEMSIVGPRPLPLVYLPRYNAAQARRHSVPPGITGWAQVHGRNATTWPERFALDGWYVDHRGWAVDLRILALTVARVLTAKDVSHPGHESMAEFKGSD